MTVLLIEDDATLGEAVRDHAASGGHAIDWMKTIDAGSSALATTAYGLILLDLLLPDGSGIKLLKEFRANGRTTPVIILTAHDQISDRIDGLNSAPTTIWSNPSTSGNSPHACWLWRAATADVRYHWCASVIL